MKIAACALAIILTPLLAGSAAAQIGDVPAPASMAWREPDPQNTLVIETNKGLIIAELYPQVAPQTVERIKILTRQGLYNGNEFFRVIEGFMNQTGDPENTGRGGSALPDLKAEFTFRRGPDVPVRPVPNRRPNSGFIGALAVTGQPGAMMALSVDGKAETSGLFCTGVLGMARAADEDSANSQFYMMRDTTEDLNRKYTAFGRVIHGLDVVKSIKAGEPVEPPRDRMVLVRLLEDIRPEDRPKARVMDTTSPAFTAYVEGLRTKTGAPNFDICDIQVATPLPK